MDKQEQQSVRPNLIALARVQELRASGEPSFHECECPEPCNCDHENE
jgi:hypothetical protein